MAGTAQPGGFRAKLLRAAQLSTLVFLSRIALRLVSITILTRLLAPDIYGVFAIILTWLYILNMMSDIGIRSLVLTHDGPIDGEFLSTCWTVSILRGVVVALMSAALAGLLIALQGREVFDPDGVYAAPVLPAALAVIGLLQIVGSAQSPLFFLNERDMAFGRVAAIEIAASVAGLVVTIAFAIWFRSVWALVAGAAVTAGMKTVASHLFFSGPRLRLGFTRDTLVTVFKRGRWIMGHSILTMLAQVADRLVLGFLLDASGFGFYYIARQFSDLVRTFLNTLHARTGLQLFTHILKAETSDIRRNYYRYRLVFDAVSGVIAGALVVLADPIVSVMFDDRYADVAPMLSILALSLLLIGPVLLRDAFSARREFRRMAALSFLSTATIWAGLVIAILAGSVPLALFFIALYRLPEAIVLAVSGAREGWIRPLREVMPLVFFALGWVLVEAAMLGLGGVI